MISAGKRWRQYSAAVVFMVVLSTTLTFVCQCAITLTIPALQREAGRPQAQRAIERDDARPGGFQRRQVLAGSAVRRVQGERSEGTRCGMSVIGIALLPNPLGDRREVLHRELPEPTRRRRQVAILSPHKGNRTLTDRLRD